MEKVNLCFMNYESPQSDVLLGVYLEGVLCASSEPDGVFDASAEDIVIKDLDW